MSGYESAARQQASRAGQRGGQRKAVLIRIGALVREYEQGRAASACMSDIKRALAGLGQEQGGQRHG